MKMIESLMTHRSIRTYKDEPVQPDVLHTIIRAGQHASTANGVQAYSVIHVTDEKKRKQLAELSKNPTQFNTAGAVLILCMDFYRIKEAARQAGKDVSFDLAENLLVATTDVALFAQNIAVAAESLGFGICYIGGVRNAPEEISELLELPEGVAPMYGLTIGVPDEEREVKPRLPIEAVVHENTYHTEKYDELIPTYDEAMNDYYQTREENKKSHTWSESMAAFLGEPRRPYMKDFLQKRGFDFK